MPEGNAARPRSRYCDVMRAPRLTGWSVLAIAVIAGSGCSAAGAASAGHAAPASSGPLQVQPQAGPVAVLPAGSAGASPGRSAPVPAPSRPSPTGRASQQPVPGPLAGKIVGIDPGHDGRNKDDAVYIDRQIWNGRELEDCDTTGTETVGGYTEAQFNFNVAEYLRTDLVKDGAVVVLTRHSNDGVGPCVTRRAAIINAARANVAIDIHADGGPSWGRGFTVLEPVADGPNNKVIASSVRFGADIKSALLAGTRMPPSDYYSSGGVVFRDDLAGLNLTTVPKILIECGNMRNATDAAMLTQPTFQRELAQAFTTAIVKFLTGR
jgi:N-acetylmuramoyl-L-alanine amidase